jgi:hypothetical protein
MAGKVARWDDTTAQFKFFPDANDPRQRMEEEQ